MIFFRKTTLFALLALIATSASAQITNVAGSIEPSPVELLDLQAHLRHEQVDIIWITATESNNDYFELERSQNNENFEVITTINGSGNSQSLLQYLFTDESPFNGHNYYRLKQVAYNGEVEYFDVVSAFIQKEKESSLRLIPNPTGQGSVLHLEATGLASNANTIIEVRTNRGVVVLFDHAMTDQQGNLSKHMSITIEQGIYIVTLACEGKGISSQLVVR